MVLLNQSLVMIENEEKQAKTMAHSENYDDPFVNSVYLLLFTTELFEYTNHYFSSYSDAMYSKPQESMSIDTFTTNQWYRH